MEQLERSGPVVTATGVKMKIHEPPVVGGRGKFPPHAFFLISAVFHQLGPAFAVLLFEHVSVSGVAWLRIASAGLVFAIWRRPWKNIAQPSHGLRILIKLGVVLGLMNVCFYQAIARLPLATVSSIEFLGPISLAALGARTPRNIAAVVLAAIGGWILTDARFTREPLGYLFAFANCAFFILYVVFGHRISQAGGAAGIDRLAIAMLIALIAVFPIGLKGALPAFQRPGLLLAGFGVGICSSVIPYVCDQMAMSRLPRATFSLLLSLLPVFAVLIGAIVLHQVPAIMEFAGILVVTAGVALHRDRNGS